MLFIFFAPLLRQNQRINDGSVSFAVHSHVPSRPYRGNGGKGGKKAAPLEITSISSVVDVRTNTDSTDTIGVLLTADSDTGNMWERVKAV